MKTEAPHRAAATGIEAVVLRDRIQGCAAGSAEHRLCRQHIGRIPVQLAVDRARRFELNKGQLRSQRTEIGRPGQVQPIALGRAQGIVTIVPFQNDRQADQRIGAALDDFIDAGMIGQNRGLNFKRAPWSPVDSK